MTTCGRYRRDTETATRGRGSIATGGAQHAKATAPIRILVVQFGAKKDRAQVFKAHAAPLGLCDDLVNALKLLVNQQKMVIVRFKALKQACTKEAEEASWTGVRRLAEADNHSAVDVGDLRRGTPSVNEKEPQFSEAFPEAVIIEGANELTLRSDEVGTQRAFTNAEHIEFERWRPPPVDADCHAFCQAIHKGIEGKEWEDLYYHFRELSQAAGAKKPSASQKAKAIWAKKAAWDRSEDFDDPARKEDILGRTETRLELWQEHRKDPLAALAKSVAIRCRPIKARALSVSAGTQGLITAAFARAKGGRTKTRLEKNISNTQWLHWRRHWNAWRIPSRVGNLVSQFVAASLCRCNGLQHRWRKDVGRPLLGWRLASPGPVGCCGFAHNVWRLERSG